jgi:outer membrane protein TolC
MIAKLRAYRNALHQMQTTIGISENEMPQIIKESAVRDDYTNVIIRQDLTSKGKAREIEILESKVRQAQREVDRTKSDYLPKVDLFARRDYAAISESSYRQAFEVQRKDKQIVGFTLSWNLFDGMHTTAEVRAASQRIMSAEAEREILVEDRRNEALNLQRLLKDVEEDLKIEEHHLELQQKKLSISQEKLALGRLSAIELDAAQTQLDDQKLQLELRTEKVAYQKAKLMLRGGVDE